MKKEHIEAVVTYIRQHAESDTAVLADHIEEVMNREITLTDIYGNLIENGLWITYPVRDSTSAYFSFGKVYAIELKNVHSRHSRDPGHTEVVLKLTKSSGKKTQICRRIGRSDVDLATLDEVIVAPVLWVPRT